MSTDIATLGMKIDASEVARADQGLDKLAETGAKTEAATKKVTSASSELMSMLRQLLDAIKTNTTAHIQAETATTALTQADVSATSATNALTQAMLKGASAASTVASAESKAAAETIKAGSAAAQADADVSAFRQEQERAGAAAAVLADRVNRLKASTDPFGAAQDKVNAELAEARMLFESGAMSATDYERSLAVLNVRNADFAAKQQRSNALLLGAGRSAKLTGAEALNLSRQFADVGVTAAMGMNPLMILIQQGPQIADIMKTSGLSIKDVFVQLGLMVGVLKEVEVAQGAAATAATVMAAANAEGAAAATAGTIAEGRLTATQTAVAASATAAAAGEAELAAATGAAALGSTAAAGAAAAVVAGNEAIATSATAAATAEAVALAPLGVILLAIAAAAAVVTGAFAILDHEVSKSVGNVTKGMGLTEKQLDRIKDKGISTSVTFGDTFMATFTVIGRHIYSALETPINWIKSAFSAAYEYVLAKVVWLIKETTGLFFGGYEAIKATWSLLPGAMGDIAIQAANATIKAIEDMVNGAIDRINALSGLANKILPEFAQIGQLGRVGMGQFDNPYAGKASAAADAGGAAFTRGQARGRALPGQIYNEIVDEARSRREKALREAAGDAEKGPKGRKGAKSEAEKAMDEAKKYLENLQDEIDKIGKNPIEVKMMEVEKAANAAAKYGFGELATQIRAAGDAWKQATIAEATRKLKEELSDLNEQTNFENSLLGMNAVQRERATAQRDIDIRLRTLEREGVDINTDAIKAETDAILANATARGERAQVLQDAQNLATTMRDQADAIKSASDAFGDYFGKGVQGFAQMIEAQTDWAAQRAEIEAQIEEARQKGADGDFERARLQQQLAQGEINSYGNIIGAAKNMFNEKSKGYKILQAVEMAYRLFQFAMSVKAMLFDSAETASSVAKSGIRAAAHAVEAVVKAIASLPFPLNLVAGAATAAAIAALGIAVFGGGGGGGGASTGNMGGDGSTDTAASSAGFNSLARNYNVTNGSSSGSSGSGAGAQGMPTTSGSPSGFSAGDMTMKVTVNQNAPGVVVDTERVGRDEIRLMVRQGVQEHAPKVVARDMSNSNSPTSKAVKANFEVAPRR
jgi:Prophage tail length tape measure protein